MNRRFLLFTVGMFMLLGAMLACNITIGTTPGGPGPGSVTETPGGGGPGPVTITDTPGVVLPPPVMASLRVSYIKGGNVWLWTEGGSSAQLTSSGDASAPMLSEDGTIEAFLRSGELWVVNADGTNERQVVSAAYLSGFAQTAGDDVLVDDHVWLPGTHILYFNTIEITAGMGFQMPQVDLHRVDADSPSPIRLESPGSGGVPAISPDGTMIALAQANQIALYAVDESFWRVVHTFTSVMTYSEWAYVPDVVWLPDSSSMRMVAPASDPLGDPTQLSTFWNIPVDGAPSVLATFLAIPAFASFPFISPDGNNVAYLSKTPFEDSIHSINSSGVDTYYLYYPANTIDLRGWAPDSVHILYELTGDNYVNYLATGENRKIADTPAVKNVTWVDGSRFLFLNGDELRLTTLDQPSSPIDSGVSEYSFGTWVH